METDTTGLNPIAAKMCATLGAHIVAKSGNEEHSVLFQFFSEGENINNIKKVVLPKGSTTQDEHRYNESHEVLFP